MRVIFLLDFQNHKAGSIDNQPRELVTEFLGLRLEMRNRGVKINCGLAHSSY